MAKLNYEELSYYQDFWRKHMASDKANKYIALSKILMHRTIDHDNNLSGVTLYYPKDCDDFSIFQDFIKIIDKHTFIEEDEKNGFYATFRGE